MKSTQFTIGPTEFVDSFKDAVYDYKRDAPLAVAAIDQFAKELINTEEFKQLSVKFDLVKSKLDPSKVKKFLDAITLAAKDPILLLITLSASKAAQADDVDRDWIDLMSICHSESGFSATALNPKSSAYGYFQILPSNVKHMATAGRKQVTEWVTHLKPLVGLVAHTQPELADTIASGIWPTSIIGLPAVWQAPYVAVLWRDAHTNLRRAFRWDEKAHKWVIRNLTKMPVKNVEWFRYMETHPEIFGSYVDGKTAILAHLWKHGAPRGLYQDVALPHITTHDDVTPVVHYAQQLEFANPILPLKETLDMLKM